MNKKELLKIIAQAAKDGRTELDLSDNDLTFLPAEIGQLKNLTLLYLHTNNLTSLPAEIWQLKNLTELWLGANNLTFLPAEIGQLKNLTTLWLHSNNLTSLPAEIGQLKNLTELYLYRNNLTSLPAEIGQLKRLKELGLDDNPLQQPPPEIVEQGTKAILAYLRELTKDKEQGKVSPKRYEAKLLILGDGGEGKTCVSRALRGLKFKKQTTTLGVDIVPWHFVHPDHPKDKTREITLNIWDFEGQEINHQSHQFFLTKRSLYLLVFKGREIFRMQRAEYWLDTIRARAPESSVILVATECEKRAPCVPFEQLKARYGDLLQTHPFYFAVGCAKKNDRGIANLRKHLQRMATDMELMGKDWPVSYANAENAIKQQARQNAHITRTRLYEIFRQNNVTQDNVEALINVMGDLGIITHFADCLNLHDFIVLKPQWLTKAMSFVLENKQLTEDKGEITHQRLKGLWDKKYPGLYTIFHNCMKEFELCYDLEDVAASMVPLRFGFTPPDIPWSAIPNAKERRIEYRFDLTPPAGIMSRFIVKTHYMIVKTDQYPKGIYWYNGVFLQTGTEHNISQALCEFDNEKRLFSITVKAAFPQNMIEQLHGFAKAVFSFFEGLKPERFYGCIKLDNKKELQCPETHSEQRIFSALVKDRILDCAYGWHDVDPKNLVFGFTSFGKFLVSTEQLTQAVKNGVKLIANDVMSLLVGLDKISDEVNKARQAAERLPAQLTQRLELKLRDYLTMLDEMLDNREFNSAPSIVSIAPVDGSKFNPSNWFNQEYVLTPYCEYHGGVHKVDFNVKFEKPRIWWEKTAPKLAIGINVLSAGLQIACAALPLAIDPKLFKQVKNEVAFMKELAAHLKLHGGAQADISAGAQTVVGELYSSETLLDLRQLPGTDEKRIVRMQLAQLLEEIAPQNYKACQWGPLKRHRMPNTTHRWLCDEHAKEYKI